MCYYNTTHGNSNDCVKIIEETERLNKIFFLYNSGFNRLSFGLLTYKLGASGCGQFMYGDVTYFNPTVNFPLYFAVVRTKDDIIPVIRWEHVREGIDDFKYIYTLEKYLEKVKDKDIKEVNKAKRILEEVKCLKLETGKGEWTGADQTSESLKKFAPTKLDEYRWKIAESIINIKKLVSK